jgi:dCMP deaminase
MFNILKKGLKVKPGKPERRADKDSEIASGPDIVVQYVGLRKIERGAVKMEDDSKKGYTRPTWDEYFMEVCRAIAKRATCDRGRSGCVIARDNQILVTGYVGSPMGLPHCDEVGHQFKKMQHEDGTVTQHCVRTVHAEQNAICQAARRGISIDGATLYCKMTPCRTCAMLIINCGIKRVVAEKRYHDADDTIAMFKQAGIKLEHVIDEVQQYDKQ